MIGITVSTDVVHVVQPLKIKVIEELQPEAAAGTALTIIV